MSPERDGETRGFKAMSRKCAYCLAHLVFSEETGEPLPHECERPAAKT
jgi:hypothetical protein